MGASQTPRRVRMTRSEPSTVATDVKTNPGTNAVRKVSAAQLSPATARRAAPVAVGAARGRGLDEAEGQTRSQTVRPGPGGRHEGGVAEEEGGKNPAQLHGVRWNSCMMGS